MRRLEQRAGGAGTVEAERGKWRGEEPPGLGADARAVALAPGETGATGLPHPHPTPAPAAG